MPLGRVTHALDTAFGSEVLEIASNDWLHTTSVHAILACLQKIKSGVGVIRPEFVGMVDLDRRRSMIQSTFAFSAATNWIITIVNIEGNHWCAFHIDKLTSHCILYDPLKNNSREKRLDRMRKLVEKDVEPLLTDRLSYQTYTELDQDDGDSCAVYAAVFLELVLTNTIDAVSIPTSTALFRMRYMRMVATMLRVADGAVAI